MAAILSAFAAMGLPSSAFSHHSFAVHYDSRKVIALTGVAKSFRFTNPHGVLELEVKDANGATQRWTIETTAPVYLQRRGWSKNSIKPGDHLVVEGWPAKDGSHLLRLRKVRLPDGTELGRTDLKNSE